MTRPRVVVVGLGPAGIELVTDAARRAIERIPHRYLRTARHPASTLVADATSFDDVYESAERLDEVYPRIVAALTAAAREHGEIVYAVPGSPLVAERTVELLRSADDVDVEIIPGLSFLDLAWARLGVDPLAEGVRLVDGQRFSVEAAGQAGPLLVAQCDDRMVLSEIKLAVDEAPAAPVVVLQRLGLPDERVFEVPWDDLDRRVEPDHLTSLWIRHLHAPVGAELVRFHELIRVLRVECPWDREQTHDSLTRHLIEETYEVVEAIAGLDAGTGDGDEELCEELGDLLMQVVLHSVMAEQEGRFTLADVARGIHDKMVRRHPHIFGDVVIETSEAQILNWERIKEIEKGGRPRSTFDGVPGNLPSLTYAHEVQRKAAKVGFDWDDVHGALPKIAEETAEIVEAHDAGRVDDIRDEVGDLLFAVVNVARHLDVDPEAALRQASAKFRARFEGVERLAGERGLDLRSLDLAALDALWDDVKRSHL